MKKTGYNIPPVTNKEDGSPRMVGFELEFSGLSLAETSNTIISSMNGEVKDGTEAEQVIHVESLGDFNIELDWDFFKRMAEENKEDKDKEFWLDQLGKAASILVPVEVVCPPVSVENLSTLDKMVSALRENGATGTEESLVAAYGVHINTEIPKLNGKTLFNYIRAFSLLQYWLMDAHDVDISRKISPYIDLYPEKYLEKIFSYKESPDFKTICEDYLEFNATRNRALDLLPLLSERYEDLVKTAVDDPKLGKRPAFHYRMPNCSINEENWSLSLSWNKWCIVEELSNSEEKIKELCEKFLDFQLLLIGVNRNGWVEYVDRWLNDNDFI